MTRRFEAVAHGVLCRGEPITVKAAPTNDGAWAVSEDGFHLGVLERRRHLNAHGKLKIRWYAFTTLGWSEWPNRTQALGRLVADARGHRRQRSDDPYDGILGARAGQTPMVGPTGAL